MNANKEELLVICDWLLGKKMKMPLLHGTAGILPAWAPAAMVSAPQGRVALPAWRIKTSRIKNASGASATRNRSEARLAWPQRSEGKQDEEDASSSTFDLRL
jgi:hypothetical protein